MANEIEKKNVGTDTPDEISEVKESEDSMEQSDAAESKDKDDAAASKEKKSKDKGAKDKSKKASAKKPKKGIVKYFKDCKAEFKKVVWPTPKETTHNTIVVIVVCLLAGLFIFGIDSLFALINSLILG